MKLFLDGRTEAQKIEDAKELLLKHGYVVKGPLLSKKAVTTPAQLVRFFYDTMYRYNPQFKMVYAGSAQKDRALAKRFVESRIELGSGSERALEECCELILLLFRYEEELGLSYKITSMSVLGQDRMGWVTEKLWRIYEGIESRVNAAAEQEWWDKLYKQQEETINEDELLSARKTMDRILERYGKSKDKKE